MAFTRILLVNFDAISLAIHCVNVSTPALAMEYPKTLEIACFEAMDEILIMEP